MRCKVNPYVYVSIRVELFGTESIPYLFRSVLVVNRGCQVPEIELKIACKPNFTVGNFSSCTKESAYNHTSNFKCAQSVSLLSRKWDFFLKKTTHTVSVFDVKMPFFYDFGFKCSSLCYLKERRIFLIATKQ